jgi:hypothetical protein
MHHLAYWLVSLIVGLLCIIVSAIESKLAVFRTVGWILIAVAAVLFLVGILA